MKLHSLTRQASSRLVTNVAGLGLSLILSLLVARQLGPAGKGLYEYAQALTLLGASVLGLGFDLAVVYAISARKIPPSRATTMLLLETLLVAIFSLIVLLANPAGLTEALLGSRQLSLVLPAWAALCGWLVASQLAAVLRAQERIGECNWSLLLFRAGPVSFFGLATLLGRASTEKAVLALAASAWVAAGWTLWRLVQSGDFRLGRFSWKDLLLLLRLGPPLQAGLISQSLSYRLGMWFVGAHISLEAVGIYTVALAVAQSLRFVPDSVVFALLPRLASANSTTSADRLAARSTLLTTGATTLGVAVAWLLAPWAVPALFGSDFAPAVPLLGWLLPGVVLASVWKLLGNYLMARRRPGLFVIASALGLLVNWGICAVITPSLGMKAAALGLTAGNAANALWCLGCFLVLRSRPELTRIEAPQLSAAGGEA